MVNLVEKKYAATFRFCNFYTGGDVIWSKDGFNMYCLNSSSISEINISTGQVIRAFNLNATPGTGDTDEEIEEDNIYTFAISPLSGYLCSAHRSGLIRLWSLHTGKVEKLWKSQHKGPILKTQFSACGRLICSSGADSSLRLWDFKNNTCICSFHDFVGPALYIEFHPSKERKELFAVGSNNTIYCWNYGFKTLIHELRGHLSQVTALTFQNNLSNCEYLVSGGRDKVLIIWKLSHDRVNQYKVIPIYEELEGACFIHDNIQTEHVYVATGNGQLSLVNIFTSKVTKLFDSSNYDIRHFMVCQQLKQLAFVTADHNILVYSVKDTTLKCVKQLIGFNDEILDICFLGHDDRFLAMATNSKDIKIYDTFNNMDCQILSGHKETVISLATSNSDNFLLSAGKDFSIFLWKLQTEPEICLNRIATNAKSHTSTIGCVAFGCNTHLVFASVSQDGTMKVWNLQYNKQDRSYNFVVKYAVVAHEKEINCIAFSQNNKIIATASLDKTCKVWNADNQKNLGTLRGHMRGVWCVRFSPFDQILLTTSSDCSIRIWSLATLSCLKRLEQESTILRAEFIDHGKYIVSAATDGLLKVWNVKTNICVQTLEEHTSRIWALAIPHYSKNYFYSGGSDSSLIRWEDITTLSRNEDIDRRQELLQQEQTLQNLLHQEKHTQKAFMLALLLGKPKVTYNIINEYVKKRQTDDVQQLVHNLNSDQKYCLLEHVKTWGTNSRYSRVSNLILNYILSDLLTSPKKYRHNSAELVEIIGPYVKRHFKRVNEMQKDLAYLEFLVISI